jgi:hypothetical protein
MDTQDLQHDLIKKIIAWVLADRVCDNHMATVDRVKREVDAHLRGGQPASDRDRELLQQLEYEEIGFKLACQREAACDEEMRAAARVLVEELEKQPGDPTLAIRVLHDPTLAIRVLHVLSAGRALCAFSLETPSKWPAGHWWTSIAELREGVAKIENVSCAACAISARVLLAATPMKVTTLPDATAHSTIEVRRHSDARWAQESPNLDRGTKVRTVCRRTGKGDYTDLAIQERAQHDGDVGTVVDYSNSHGLCYEVRFESGTAWFDPEELTPI